MSGENRKLGCFRLLDEVGKGSQGIVYKAVCEKEEFEGVPVGATVALKVLSTLDGGKERFAKLRARVDDLRILAHPEIVRYFGCFCESGPFGDMHVLVTEWLEGETLKDRLRRNSNGFDADEALRIGEQLLAALVYSSENGIVHQNINADNIFLCEDAGVKLVGFEGLGLVSNPAVAGLEGLIITLDYCAPDFINPTFFGDEQSDVFSVGVCLYEMFTGRLPYQDVNSPAQKDGRINAYLSRWGHAGKSDGTVEIHTGIRRIMSGAADVLAKALHPNRAERYATLADFAAAYKGIRCRELTRGENTWRLLQYVGRGGFSEVFKARDVKTGQIVAIKHLLKCQYMDRFDREACALLQLEEPSIVRFITYCEDEFYGSGAKFLVMEYLDGMPGQSLLDEMKRTEGKTIRRDQIIRAFVNYAHGLSVMHAKGFVHRDIKPSKLYFPADAIEQAKIMSSTIVRDMSGTITAGAVPGTLDYMPPEVAVTEDRGSPAMDVFALGLSLYEALSGKTAYPRLPTGTEGLLAFVKRAKEKIRPTLDESAYSDLQDLVRLVREMTEPDVAKRLKDAAEVERRLRVLLERRNIDHDEQPAIEPYREVSGYEDVYDGCWPPPSEGLEELLKRYRRQHWLKLTIQKLWECIRLPLVLLAATGCVAGLFGLCEMCIGDTALELKSSLSMRVLALFPWLIGSVWIEAKTGRFPNWLTAGCLLSGIGVSTFSDGVSMLSSMSAVAAGAVLLLPVFMLKAMGAGEVKMFAAALSFWGIRYVPFEFASLLCMGLPVCLVAGPLRRCFTKCGDHAVPSSPIVLGSMLSLAVALWFWSGQGMLGGYIFMAGTLVLAAVARLLFRERKQHAEEVSTPSSACAAETATLHADFNVDDARTVTTTGSESHGLLDATCRDSDDLVSETEGGTGNPSAFLNLHGHATVHGFRLDPSPLVAEGGQGRVFKAECVEEGRLGLRKGEVVALKFVEETPSSPSFEEFEKAVAYLREIKSSHVPRYYGCFRVERWINGTLKRFRMTVMEYLDGADLGYRVKVRSPNFYADEIMYVLDQLLEGLCELAEAGVIHRDIKPSNVFICRDGTVKLIDFDTALIRGIDLCPKNRKIVGTPEFAAPDYLVEGFRGDEISDVFSVGMTLYYMVHGVSPHRARGMLSGRMDEKAFRVVWGKHQEESEDHAWWKWDVKKAGDWLSGEARPYVPLLGIQRLFGRCVTADRNRRFASFSEFRTNLQMVEFVRVRLNDKCLRVISDVQCTSGAGAGYSCVYQRDESGRVQEFDCALHFFNCRDVCRDGRDCLDRYLANRMYDQDALDPLVPYWPKDRMVARRVHCCPRAITDQVLHEKFSSENVHVLCKSFADVRPLKEWQREVAHHEHLMQLS